MHRCAVAEQCGGHYLHVERGGREKRSLNRDDASASSRARREIPPRTGCARIDQKRGPFALNHESPTLPDTRLRFGFIGRAILTPRSNQVIRSAPETGTRALALKRRTRVVRSIDAEKLIKLASTKVNPVCEVEN